MKTTKTTQAATTYLNANLRKPKTISKQLTIETKQMARGYSPNYNFTKDNHFEIIEKIETFRIANNLDCSVLSKNAGCAKSTYSNLKNCVQRFGNKTYPALMAFISAPVQKKETELTAQKCIDFLKATGEYKISKAETITNWIEL